MVRTMTQWWEPLGQFIVEHSLWTHAIAFGTGALGGGWVWKLLEHNRGRDDLNLRRRSEVMKTFPAVSARAYGTREDGTRISSSEQVAAMHVMADMANEYDWLIPAVVVQLDEQLFDHWHSALPTTVVRQINQDKASRGMLGPNDPHTQEFSTQLWQKAAHRDRMVDAIKAARAKIVKAEPFTPPPEQKVYLGELGPYHY